MLYGPIPTPCAWSLSEIDPDYADESTGKMIPITAITMIISISANPPHPAKGNRGCERANVTRSRFTIRCAV